MTRFRGSILTNTCIFISCLMALVLLQPVALAQHGAAATHMGGGVHFASPPSSPPIVHPYAAGPHFAPAPAVGAFGFRGVPFRAHYPIYPYYGSPFFFGEPFWGFGAGWGFNSFLWSSSDLFWLWGLGYTAPLYSYGGAYDYVPPTYAYPVYLSGEQTRELPQLYLKDGTMFTVTDYWLVDDQLHFTALEPGPEGGTRTIEHVIDYDELDVQTTVDVATRHGFRFVLRNEPLEQYMKDHPNEYPPPVTPPRLQPQ
jgi:hypothetical protein